MNADALGVSEGIRATLTVQRTATLVPGTAVHRRAVSTAIAGVTHALLLAACRDEAGSMVRARLVAHLVLAASAAKTNLALAERFSLEIGHACTTATASQRAVIALVTQITDPTSLALAHTIQALRIGRAGNIADQRTAVTTTITGKTLANWVTNIITHAHTLVTAVVRAVAIVITVLTLPAGIANTLAISVALTMLVASETASQAVEVSPWEAALAHWAAVVVCHTAAMTTAVLGVAVLTAITLGTSPSIRALAAIGCAHTVTRAVGHAQRAVRAAKWSTALAHRLVLAVSNCAADTSTTTKAIHRITLTCAVA